jgi:hypothetical protein
MKIFWIMVIWFALSCSIVAVIWVAARARVRFRLWQERKKIRSMCSRRLNFKQFTSWANAERKKYDG